MDAAGLGLSGTCRRIRMDGRLVGAVTVERVGPGALAWRRRRIVEEVAVGQGGGLELGVGLAESEALHRFAGAAVRAGAVGDLGLLVYPPVRQGRDPRG